MTIYEAIRNDHVKVTRLLDELVRMNEGDAVREELIEQIRDELIPHARAEESILYNTLRSLDQSKDVVQHAYREHMEAESLLRLLQLKEKVDLDWKSTAIKLQQALSHHIQEEESEVFAAAKKVITAEEAMMMGVAFERLKPEVREEGFVKTSMDLVANMMPPRFSASFRDSHFDLRK